METRWNRTAVWAFESVFRPWMRRRLAGVHVSGLPDTLPEGRTVVLAANHVSWWDGFLLREVHRSAGSTDPLFTLMHADELARLPYFRLMGVVGLKPRSPGSVLRVLHFLRAMRRRHPSCWLAVFPQGRIRPSWARPMALQPGIAAFARVLAPSIVLPVGLHLEPMNRVSARAFVSLGEPIPVDAGQSFDIDAVERGLLDALDRVYDLLVREGEEAPHRWPDVLHLPSARLPVRSRVTAAAGTEAERISIDT